MLNPPPGRRWPLLLLVVLAAGSFSAWFHHTISPAALPAAGRPAIASRSSAGSSRAMSAPAADPVSAPVPVALFTFATPVNAAALDAALPAPAREIHYVRLNLGLIAGKQSPFWQKPGAGRFELPLPGGGTVAVVIDGSEMLGADRFVSSGRVEGRPESRAVFAYNEGFLHGSIEDPVLGNFALRAADEEYSQFYQIDPVLVAPCGGTRRPIIDGAAIAAAAARRARGGPGSTAAIPAAPGTAAAEHPQSAEIQVMMVYTQAVLSTLAGTARTAALQSAFDAAVAKVNSTFDASQITARVRLVKILETQYAPDGPTGVSTRNLQDDALTALQSPTDGRMDEVLVARDQSGADIVCLALNRFDPASSGLSFLLDSPGENLNAVYAFSIVQYSNVEGTNVVAHEFGHVLGCAHDRENALSGPGSYPYSYGYRFFGADGRQYRDIMSYPPGSELGYFSNPNIVIPPPVNMPIGIAPGKPGEADAALTIEQNAFEVSTYRLQTQAAPNPGTFINVATRAFAGTGNQVLIGGFVVEGSRPARMLVRGSGPALAAFGIGSALVDPILRVFSGPVQIAENDNWGSQPGAGDVANAAAQVGAFAFAPNSADAALLVTLGPGAYTAIIEGARATTGFGLVEVYQVDRNVNRIVNLATRGYAGTQGREMVGGFAVTGTAGTTKRILVRVLGPTLGRAPFNIPGTLDDPQMEIHNAAGELLILNDDWCTSARFVGGTRDDFQPLVRYYNEEHIAATGLAPANRREPCVLVDLPPGNYTVIVRPFEDLTLTPPEPALPGVGIIEVYEINL